jgi:hypothetical protein
MRRRDWFVFITWCGPASDHHIAAVGDLHCAGDEILEVLHARQRGSGAFALCRTVVILDVAPGTTCGNHRADFPRHPGASQGMVSQVKRMKPAL